MPRPRLLSAGLLSPACCQPRSPRVSHRPHGPDTRACRRAAPHRGNSNGTRACATKTSMTTPSRSRRQCHHAAPARRPAPAFRPAASTHLLEGEGIASAGDSYNSGANGRTTRPAITDPEGAELNQAWIGWKDPHVAATLGRQRLLFDNQRWIGNSGWRQNEQTFDALAVDWQLAPPLTLRYAWLGRCIASTATIGYGLGCAVAWVVRRCGIRSHPSPRTRLLGWRGLAVAALVVVPLFLVLGSWWQQILRDLVGLPRAQRSFYILVFVIAVVVATALLAIARGLRSATNWLATQGNRVVSVPDRSTHRGRVGRGIGGRGTQRRTASRPAECSRKLSKSRRPQHRRGRDAPRQHRNALARRHPDKPGTPWGMRAAPSSEAGRPPRRSRR